MVEIILHLKLGQMWTFFMAAHANRIKMNKNICLQIFRCAESILELILVLISILQAPPKRSEPKNEGWQLQIYQQYGVSSP